MDFTMMLGNLTETHRSNSESLKARFTMEVKKHSKSHNNNWSKRVSQICGVALVLSKTGSVSTPKTRKKEGKKEGRQSPAPFD